MNYKRITKPTARKMFNSGCTLFILPCKVGDSALEGKNPWISPVTVNIIDCRYDANKFDRFVNDFEYYNCNADLGYYAHFFVTEEEYNKYEMCKLMCNQGGN